MRVNKSRGGNVGRLLLVSAALAFCASGCVSVEPGNVSPSSPQTNSYDFSAGGTVATFPGVLRQEYAQIVATEKRRYDWRSAEIFQKKLDQVAAGSAVTAEVPSAWAITDSTLRHDLKEARSCLMVFVPDLSSNGSEIAPACDLRATQPVAAAHGIGRFDCWVESGVDFKPEDTGAPCRSEFIASFTYLSRAAELAAQVPNSPCKLDAETTKLLERCKAQLKPGQPSASLPASPMPSVLAWLVDAATGRPSRQVSTPLSPDGAGR